MTKRNIERRLNALEDEGNDDPLRVVINEETVDKNGDVVETNRKVIELGGGEND